MTVSDSTLTDNLAQGAPLAANVVPSQSVLSNSATAGGGIFCLDLFGGPVLIAGSTLTGNQAVGGSGRRRHSPKEAASPWSSFLRAS